MPEKLKQLFAVADGELFNLHCEMEQKLQGLPGDELWREVYGLRLKLRHIEQIAKNNFAMPVHPDVESKNAD